MVTILNKIKQKLIDFDKNAQNRECNELFIASFLCFILGIILFFCESGYIMLYPKFILWLPCFLLGIIFLIPWLMYG